MTFNTEQAQSNLRAERETLSRLISARAAHDERAAALARERKEISFDWFQGDEAAARRLKHIHQEVAVVESEAASLDAAIETANKRVADALVDLARAEAADNGRQALALLDEFRAHGARLDAACNDLIDNYAALAATHRSLLALGVKSPSTEMVENGARRSVIWALQQTALALHRSPSAFLAPSERRTFTERTEGWAQSVENWANAQLEQPETEEA